MCSIDYLELNQIDPPDFLPLLNKQTTREHLIDHELFDVDRAKKWVHGKTEVDASKGCRVRAITVDGSLAGWCGIQFEEDKYEIAVVIDDRFWGLGKTVFRELMKWAKEFGHATIYIHFLHTRPEYKFLRKLSTKVYQSELLGSRFTTYELEVN